MITITREIQFDAGHCLKQHHGHCQNLHGHRYRLLVSIALDDGKVQNKGSSDGMVMDFAFLKEIMMREVHEKFDHKFIIEDTDERVADIYNMQPDATVILFFTPTVENLAFEIWKTMKNHLPKDVKLIKVTLYETPNNFAEVYGE
jgi:6-pyruvoyltetrahydropterin/6-carboxytetrahydropterin synthase